MSVRDIEREREIEAMDDVAALKRSRSSRRGQITKVEKDMDKYLATPIVGLKKRILESSLHALRTSIVTTTLSKIGSWPYSKAVSMNQTESTLRIRRFWKQKTSLEMMV